MENKYDMNLGTKVIRAGDEFRINLPVGVITITGIDGDAKIKVEYEGYRSKYLKLKMKYDREARLTEEFMRNLKKDLEL